MHGSLKKRNGAVLWTDDLNTLPNASNRFQRDSLKHDFYAPIHAQLSHAGLELPHNTSTQAGFHTHVLAHTPTSGSNAIPSNGPEPAIVDANTGANAAVAAATGPANALLVVLALLPVCTAQVLKLP